MNDHGPRTDIYGDINSKFVSETLRSKHGVFVYK